MKTTIIIFLSLFACSSREKLEEKSYTEYIPEFYKTCLVVDTIKIDNSLGIVSLSDDYKFGDIIEVLDDRGIKKSSLSINEETEVLALKCLAIDSNKYKILLPNSELGFISKSAKVKFETWEKHILSLFAVGFDPEKNPIKEFPLKSSETRYYDKEEFYHPVEINEDWLKIKWGSNNNWEYGWIKWRRRNELLVEMFYFA